MGKKTSDIESFICMLREEAEKIGFSIPQPHLASKDGIILCNLSLYPNNYKDVMREAYLSVCDLSHSSLDKSWIDKTFMLEENKVSIIGLDFDCGSCSIRVEDKNGNEFNVHPDKVREIFNSIK